MVEFTLTLLLFLTLVFGLFDFGRAAWAYNMVSEAARSGAREGIIAASSYTNPGSYNLVIQHGVAEIIPGAASVDSTQNGTSNTSFTTLFCTSSHRDGSCASPNPGTAPCSPGAGNTIPNDYVSVAVTGSYQPVVGKILGINAPISLRATSVRCLTN